MVDEDPLDVSMLWIRTESIHTEFKWVLYNSHCKNLGSLTRFVAIYLFAHAEGTRYGLIYPFIDKHHP